MDSNNGTLSGLGALRVGVRQGFLTLLGRRRADDRRPTVFQGGDEDTIRGALLGLLPESDTRHAVRLAGLRRRIQYAPDCDALWYLRADVLTLLASVAGEAQARQQIAAVDHLFPRGGSRRR